MIAGLFNMVPYLGVITGLILGLAMAFLNFTSWWQVRQMRSPSGRSGTDSEGSSAWR